MNSWKDILPIRVVAIRTALYALLIGVLSGTGGGAYLGYRWMSGKVAKAEAQLLKRERDDAVAAANRLAEAAETIRIEAAAGATRQQEAARRMEVIANQLETQRHAIEEFQTKQRNSLESILQARPDLRSLDLGDDVLRHWNQSNSGPNASSRSAPAASPSQRLAIVSSAAVNCIRDGPTAAGQSRCRDGAVPRMQGDTRSAGEFRQGMASHRGALVLQRAGSQQNPQQGLRQ